MQGSSFSCLNCLSFVKNISKRLHPFDAAARLLPCPNPLQTYKLSDFALRIIGSVTKRNNRRTAVLFLNR